MVWPPGDPTGALLADAEDADAVQGQPAREHGAESAGDEQDEEAD